MRLASVACEVILVVVLVTVIVGISSRVGTIHAIVPRLALLVLVFDIASTASTVTQFVC